MNKKLLRRQMLERRNKLSQEEIFSKSKQIKNILFNLEEYCVSKVILSYISFSSEVNTFEIIKESILKGKKVVVPISIKEKRELLLSTLCNFEEELTLGSYNILEPKKEYIRIISSNEINLILVPGIAFSKQGDRIGYGKGYFDRLLSKITCFKIGLAFNFQIIEQITPSQFDIKVDKIITEERIINNLSKKNSPLIPKQN